MDMQELILACLEWARSLGDDERDIKARWLASRRHPPADDGDDDLDDTAD